MIYEHAGFPPATVRLRSPSLSFACAPIGLRFGHPCKFLLVIPASEPESWAALCWGIALRYRLAIVILALAPQDPVSEHGVTGREENARTKGCHTQKPPETFPFPAG